MGLLGPRPGVGSETLYSTYGTLTYNSRRRLKGAKMLHCPRSSFPLGAKGPKGVVGVHWR